MVWGWQAPRRSQSQMPCGDPGVEREGKGSGGGWQSSLPVPGTTSIFLQSLIPNGMLGDRW